MGLLLFLLTSCPVDHLKVRGKPDDFPPPSPLKYCLMSIPSFNVKKHRCPVFHMFCNLWKAVIPMIFGLLVCNLSISQSQSRLHSLQNEIYKEVILGCWVSFSWTASDEWTLIADLNRLQLGLARTLQCHTGILFNRDLLLRSVGIYAKGSFLPRAWEHWGIGYTTASVSPAND